MISLSSDVPLTELNTPQSVPKKKKSFKNKKLKIKQTSQREAHTTALNEAKNRDTADPEVSSDKRVKRE